MKRRRAVGLILVLLVAFGVGWFLFFELLRWYGPATRPPVAPARTVPANTPKINAKLFYLSDDGTRLVPAEREVEFGAGIVEQARRIVEAQLASPPPPLASAIPPGTRLRAIYVTEHGEAYVDLSAEIRGIPGGSLSEILAVYTLVDVLTTNLPAVTSVQILVDGREVDTLAGHVDLRRPLPKNPAWVEDTSSPKATPDKERTQS